MVAQRVFLASGVLGIVVGCGTQAAVPAALAPLAEDGEATPVPVTVEPEIATLPRSLESIEDRQGEAQEYARSNCGGGSEEIRQAIRAGAQVVELGPVEAIEWSEEEYESEAGTWRYGVQRGVAEVDGARARVESRIELEVRIGDRFVAPREDWLDLSVTAATPSYAVALRLDDTWRILEVLPVASSSAVRLRDGSVVEVTTLREGRP